MDKIPNDIIMRIIREADGGRQAHEKKFNLVMADLAYLGENCGGWVYERRETIPWREHETSELLFDDWHGSMTSVTVGRFVNNLAINWSNKFRQTNPSIADGWLDFTHLAPYN